MVQIFMTDHPYPISGPADQGEAHRNDTMTEPYRISCVICGKACKWVPADPDIYAPNQFGGWYCESCDTFTETDVE
jgi:hypothetical protein